MDHNGWTPLHHAARLDKKDVVQYIVEHSESMSCDMHVIACDMHKIAHSIGYSLVCDMHVIAQNSMWYACDSVG